VKEGAPAVVLAERYGTINADLTVGTDVTAAQPLHANEGICSPGVKLHGAGFMVSPATARALGLGRVPGLERHIRPYLNGRDLTQHSRGQMVIDLDGLNEQQVRRRFPDVYPLVSGQKPNNSNWLASVSGSICSGAAESAVRIGIFSNTVTERTCSNV
jgi:hypothetical protein